MVVFVGKPMIQCWLFVNRRFTSRPRSKRQIVPPVFRAVLQSGEEVRLAVFLLVVQGLWQGDPTKLHRLSPMIVMTLNGSRNRWVPRSLYIYIYMANYMLYIYYIYSIYHHCPHVLNFALKETFPEVPSNLTTCFFQLSAMLSGPNVGPNVTVNLAEPASTS